MDYTGLTLEESYGDGWIIPFHPDDRKRAWEAWQNAVNNDAAYSLECRLRRADGAYRWWLIRGTPLRDESGKIIKWFGTCSDIQDMKQIEEALRYSEDRLRLLGDNLPDSAVYQYMHDTDGTPRFLYISSGIERLNGVTVEDVLGDARALHGQILPEYYSALVEAEAVSARDLSDFSMDIQMRRPDGEVRWMRLRSRPRRLPEGRVVWDGVQIDVTERKQAEELLQRTVQRFYTVLSGMYAAVLLVSEDDRVEFANQAFCDMYRPQGLAG